MGRPAGRGNSSSRSYMAMAFSGQTASAQTGFTGIFGGGPFYKNAANNITE